MSAVEFDHIAIAARRMADAPAVLVGALGGAPTGEGGPSVAYPWGQWVFAGGGRLEILEPLGDDGFLHRFLAARGPGIHHVTFRVPHLDEACERAVAHGCRIVGHDDSDPGWAEAFLHPKEALGIVVQLVQSRATPDTPRPPFRAPAGPPDPPPPVTVLGVRLRARSAERADTLLARVLSGHRAAAGGVRLVYRWPGSPMRLAVDVEADADEGPTAVEFASARPSSLPQTPHPLLGTSFRRVTA
jgi:methylmalonyl-CoA/ethylmalonyl-CoA epimerase